MWTQIILLWGLIFSRGIRYKGSGWEPSLPMSWSLIMSTTPPGHYSCKSLKTKLEFHAIIHLHELLSLERLIKYMACNVMLGWLGLNQKIEDKIRTYLKFISMSRKKKKERNTGFVEKQSWRISREAWVQSKHSSKCSLLDQQSRLINELANSAGNFKRGDIKPAQTLDPPFCLLPKMSWGDGPHPETQAPLLPLCFPQNSVQL